MLSRYAWGAAKQMSLPGEGRCPGHEMTTSMLFARKNKPLICLVVSKFPSLSATSIPSRQWGSKNTIISPTSSGFIHIKLFPLFSAKGESVLGPSLQPPDPSTGRQVWGPVTLVTKVKLNNSHFIVHLFQDELPNSTSYWLRQKPNAQDNDASMFPMFLSVGNYSRINT